MEQKEIEQGKTIAIISYIIIIGVLIAMSMNAEEKNKYASFHIRQGLGLTLTFISLGVIISNFNSIFGNCECTSNRHRHYQNGL